MKMGQHRKLNPGNPKPKFLDPSSWVAEQSEQKALNAMLSYLFGTATPFEQSATLL